MGRREELLKWLSSTVLSTLYADLSNACPSLAS